jgi:hypothetical protein
VTAAVTCGSTVGPWAQLGRKIGVIAPSTQRITEESREKERFIQRELPGYGISRNSKLLLGTFEKIDSLKNRLYLGVHFLLKIMRVTTGFLSTICSAVLFSKEPNPNISY